MTMHLEPNSYFIRPMKTNHQGQPQPTRHKQAPGDRVCQGAWGSRGGRQEQPQERVENEEERTNHLHSAVETEMRATPGVSGRSKPTLLPEMTTPSSICTLHARPCLLQSWMVLHPRNSGCAGGSELLVKINPTKSGFKQTGSLNTSPRGR